ncbi:MAG: coat protein, partial [Clostridia bacterium]|nr:coat protein [Clostridia bacterium]
MADFTTIESMVTIPEHFSKYVVDRTTELNTFINSGIASPDARVAQLINGSPEGGRFIYLPSFNPLDGDDEVFGEDDVSIDGIDTKEAKATLLMRQKAWGSTDLAHVLSGADPMGAIAQLIADWRNTKEQAVYLSILKGLFATGGALTAHVNDISTKEGEAAVISNNATLDTKQLLGDHYASLGMVFMHSAVYTDLQKKGMITRTPIFDPSKSPIEMEEYLGYRIKVDDAMPVTEGGVYDTYFLGKNSFIRQD